MKRKVISAVLAGACALSALSFSATTVAAKDKDVKAAGSVTLKSSAAVATANINVSVPSAIAAVINPYGIEVTIGKAPKAVTYGATGVASGIYTIKNYGDNDIYVTVTPTIVVPMSKKDSDEEKTVDIAVKTVAQPSDSLDSAGDTVQKASGKALCAYLVAEVGEYNNYYDGMGSTEADKDNAFTNFLTDLDIYKNTGTPTVYVPFYDVSGLKGDKLAEVQKTAKTKGTDFITIPAAYSKNEEDKTIADPHTYYSCAQFGIGGQINGGASDWTKSDKLTLSLVLDFDVHEGEPVESSPNDAWLVKAAD